MEFYLLFLCLGAFVAILSGLSGLGINNINIPSGSNTPTSEACTLINLTCHCQAKPLLKFGV